MINKEEIEKAKTEGREIIGNFKSATTDITKDIFPKKANTVETLLEYIDQLETSKQKLIEKLEERRNKAREFCEEAKGQEDKIRRSSMDRAFK